MIKNIAILLSVTTNDLLKRNNRITDNSKHIEMAFQWLMNAQDAGGESGGVSEGFHLIHGWLPSYPETTGYIIETFFDYFYLTENIEFNKRALKMADWLVSIQNSDGSIPDSYFKKKMVFDTGQVLFGFVRGFEETGQQQYLDAALKAGRWLTGVQDNDGAWRSFAVENIPHTYYTRVAWSLLRLHSLTGEERFKRAAINNIKWALSRQAENGWFDEASFNLSNHLRPFTHTIAYTLRGILEAGIYLEKQYLIQSVLTTVNNLITIIDNDGFICGTYDKEWNGDRSFCCLTGSAQLAIILFKLFAITKDPKYRDVALEINTYLKKRQQLFVKFSEISGAIGGSSPIWGKYIHFMYPNWAAKFYIDSLMIEQKVMQNA